MSYSVDDDVYMQTYIYIYTLSPSLIGSHGNNILGWNSIIFSHVENGEFSVGSLLRRNS